MLHMLPALLLFNSLLSNPAAAPEPCHGIETVLVQASKELAHGAAETAANLLAPLAADHEACPAVILTEARISAGRGNASEASAFFERYLQLQPDTADAANGYAWYARFLLDREQYQQADELSAQALAKNGDSAPALAVRGQILAMKGSRDEAAKLLARACELDPDDVRTQFDLGSLEDHAKHPGQAVLHLERVTAITPQNAQAWDYLALNREKLGQIDGALEAYAKGLAVNQQGPFYDAFLDYNYGRLLMKLNRLTDSKIHLDRAVQLVPQMRATWYERAKLDLLLKDYNQARSDGEQAQTIPDEHGYIIDLQIYTLLEQVYRRLGEADLAAKYAELERQTPPPVRGEHP